MAVAALFIYMRDAKERKVRLIDAIIADLRDPRGLRYMFFISLSPVLNWILVISFASFCLGKYLDEKGKERR